MNKMHVTTSLLTNVPFALFLSSTVGWSANPPFPGSTGHRVGSVKYSPHTNWLKSSLQALYTDTQRRIWSNTAGNQWAVGDFTFHALSMFLKITPVLPVHPKWRVMDICPAVTLCSKYTVQYFPKTPSSKTPSHAHPQFRFSVASCPERP